MILAWRKPDEPGVVYVNVAADRIVDRIRG